MVEFYDPIAKKNISYHLDTKLIKMWDALKEGGLAKLNEDRIYIGDGRERVGKTSFIVQQAKYIDPTFDISRICFTPNDFLYQIRTAPKNSVVVFDEAFRGLSSKSTRSTVNKAIVEALMEVGQRNLVIFIVLPTIFLLELYAAVFRSEALFHVYKLKSKTTDGRKKRAFKIYNYVKKKQLYLRGKTKYFSYAQPKIRKAKGRFFVKVIEGFETGIPYETFDMDAYLKKKDEAFRNSGQKEDKEETKYMKQRDLIIKGLYNLGQSKKYDEFKSHVRLSKWLESVGLELGGRSIGNIVGNSAETMENGK